MKVFETQPPRQREQFVQRLWGRAVPGVLEEQQECAGVWRRVSEEEVRAGRWPVGAAGRTWAFTPVRLDCCGQRRGPT